jgi:hypothetical protein
MTIPKKMKEKLKQNRDYRNFASFEIRADEENEELFVEGKACSFDDPTVLYSFNGIDYKEQIDSRAFEDAEMEDVIFNYNHGGKVVARTRNDTLELNVKEDGLYVKAKLDGTEEGRKLYEEIKGGYIDKMSFAFSVQEDSYDTDEHLRTVRKVKRLYDVSAVDIPAYDSTSVAARSFEKLEKEKEKLKRKKRKVKLLTKI